MLAFLVDSYEEKSAADDRLTPATRHLPLENDRSEGEVVLHLHPRLAPIKVAVFPLVKKDGMPEIARKIHRECRDAGLACFYDEKGAVGRRYRRQDEAGTPFCVTVDGQTLQDQTVTLRDRDSLQQERIPAAQVLPHVRGRLS